MNPRALFIGAALAAIAAQDGGIVSRPRGFGKTTEANHIRKRIGDALALAGKPWKRGKPVRIRRREHFQRRRRTAQDRLAAIRMYQAAGSPEMVALVKRRR